MSTKRQRLHETLMLARKHYQVPPTHTQNESNWIVFAVEPVLAALEWPRVTPADRNAPEIDGAAYEWPSKHKIDTVLFTRGYPIAVMESKDTPGNARRDLLSPRLQTKVDDKNRVRLSTCTWGIYSWFKDGGGFGWTPYADGNPGTSHDSLIHFKDLAKLGDADRLAQLARPVLTGQVSQSSWLGTPIDDRSAIEPRFDLIKVQACFFETLKSEIDSRYHTDIQVRLSCKGETRNNLAAPGRAYSDLPPFLPPGWGVKCDLEPFEDYLQCLFFRGGKQHHKPSAIKDNYHGVPEPSFVDDFVRNKVLPRIEQHLEASRRATGRC